MVIIPLPSLSKRPNASLNSKIYKRSFNDGYDCACHVILLLFTLLLFIDNFYRMKIFSRSEFHVVKSFIDQYAVDNFIYNQQKLNLWLTVWFGLSNQAPEYCTPTTSQLAFYWVLFRLTVMVWSHQMKLDKTYSRITYQDKTTPSG